MKKKKRIETYTFSPLLYLCFILLLQLNDKLKQVQELKRSLIKAVFELSGLSIGVLLVSSYMFKVESSLSLSEVAQFHAVGSSFMLVIHRGIYFCQKKTVTKIHDLHIHF